MRTHALLAAALARAGRIDRAGTGAAGPAPRTAAADLQGRGQLRRDRRRRHRRAGELRRRPDQDDFQVVEEGKPQTVSAFTRVDIPIERPDPPLFRQTAIEPDVRTNRDEFNGRVFLMVLDDLQTDSARTMLVRAAARQFIRRSVGANDMVAIVTTGGNASAGQEFTSSRPRLLAAVEKFIGHVDDDDYYRRDGRRDGIGDGAASRRATPTPRSATSPTTWPRVRGRRKAIVWFGEGIDYNIDNDFSRTGRQTIRAAMQDTIAAATRAGRELLRRGRPRRRRGARRSHRDLRRFPTIDQPARRRSGTRCAGRRTACGRFPRRPAASRSSTRTI